MNIFKSKKLIATALTFVMVMILAGLPLSAKERRGSTVVVTMADGSQVKGELLAVKSDILLVYDRDAGQGKSLDLQQVVRVKVLKKSKILQGLVIGLGVGLGIGFCKYQLEKTPDEEGMAGLTIVYLMPKAGLIGGILGAFAGIPKNFSLAGASSQSRQENLERLKHYAREQEFEKPVAH